MQKAREISPNRARQFVLVAPVLALALVLVLIRSDGIVEAIGGADVDGSNGQQDTIIENSGDLSTSLPMSPDIRVPLFVGVKFCVVDDGRVTGVPAGVPPANGAGNPDGRFAPANLLAGLAWKSIIWGTQANIWFYPNGVVVIPDPNPNAGPAFGDGGALGDVADPFSAIEQAKSGLGLETQWQAVKRICDSTIGPLAPEKITDIVVRRFFTPVNTNAADGTDEPGDIVEAGTIWGVSQLPTCSVEPATPPKPSVEDPEQFPAIQFLNFGEVLAHENGHALCLPHAGAHPQLMKGTARPPFGATRLNAAGPLSEVARARKQVQDHYSSTRAKDHEGLPVPEPRPSTRETVDNSGDVSSGAIDIIDVVASRRVDNGLGITMDLRSVLPDDVTGLEYVFAVDVDNDLGTGKQAGITGTDLLVEVSVSQTAGQPSLSTSVKRVEAGEFVEFTGPGIVTELETATIGGSTSKGAPGQELALHDSIFFKLPANLLPLPLAEGYRVAASASDQGGDADAAPVLVGSVSTFVEPQSITLGQTTASSGDAITVSGVGFTPTSSIDVLLATEVVASGVSDAGGAFSIDFVVPEPTDETFLCNFQGNLVTSIMAVDESAVGDAMSLSIGVDSDGDSTPDTPHPRCPPGVGGTLGVLDEAESPAEASGQSSGGDTALVAAAVAGGIVALAAGGWYARRRFRQRRIS